MKMRKQVIVAAAISGIALLCAVMVAAAGRGAAAVSGDDGAKLVGQWRGESICVGDNPACHDEKVVYHISAPPDGAGRVSIAADKIIDGKPVPMGVMECKYDGAKGTLTSEFTTSRYHGVWAFTVREKMMEGTLTLLPAKTIARRVKVTRDES